MGRANLIAELLKGKPVKKFVVVGNGPKLNGAADHSLQIGSVVEQAYETVDKSRVVVKFPESTDAFSVDPDYLRELDDSPIVAGDEVVCVQATAAIAIGKSYIAKPAQCESEDDIWVEVNGGDPTDIRSYSPDYFVKVKPLPEVKQEATEKSEHDSFFVKTKLHDGSTVEQWFPTHAAACKHAKEMVISGVASRSRVCKTVTLIEAQEPKITSF